jgi:hypothetical protein
MLDVEVGGGPDFQKAQLFNDKREGAVPLTIAIFRCVGSRRCVAH